MTLSCCGTVPCRCAPPCAGLFKNTHKHIVSVTGMLLRDLRTCRAALPGAAIALTAVFLLAGCAAESAPSAPVPGEAGDSGSAGMDEATSAGQNSDVAAEGPAAGSGSASVTLTGQSFTFEIDMCMIGEDDVLIAGPGRDDDSGEPAYFDLDFVMMSTDDQYGEVRINLGTDQPLASTDQFLAMWIGEGRDSAVSFGSGSLQADGEFLAANGSPVGPGAIVVDCS